MNIYLVITTFTPGARCGEPRQEEDMADYDHGGVAATDHVVAHLQPRPHQDHHRFARQLCSVARLNKSSSILDFQFSFAASG